ncbi:hypothetical protein PRZ48_011261 [Zasmidium cellare]|uniref:Major facilitator superfamily (MFS) profile domain-containing protein n=1 Tax=Zasmidium cellare TaxID=395010 RepID=A0ABR0EAV6_ZASCE|nr:hypothetical protein PRZ48_011261 [Zasmidium cellare]
MPAFLVFGYNQSATGGILAYPSFVHAFPEIDTTDVTGKKKVHKATIQGTVVAMYNIGCLIGALAAVPLGNRMGRRRALAISCIIGLIGHALQASSFSLGQLIAGRIVAGIGLGGMNALVPVWQSESVKPKSRGKNVVVVTLFITIGQGQHYSLNHLFGTVSGM